METKKNIQYGCITEQGDLGLGFDVLNESDQSTMRKNAEKDSEDKDKENR